MKKLWFKMELAVQYLFKPQIFHAIFDEFLRVRLSIGFISIRPRPQSVPTRISAQRRPKVACARVHLPRIVRGAQVNCSVRRTRNLCA